MKRRLVCDNCDEAYVGTTEEIVDWLRDHDCDGPRPTVPSPTAETELDTFGDPARHFGAERDPNYGRRKPVGSPSGSMTGKLKSRPIDRRSSFPPRFAETVARQVVAEGIRVAMVRKFGRNGFDVMVAACRLKGRPTKEQAALRRQLSEWLRVVPAWKYRTKAIAEVLGISEQRTRDLLRYAVEDDDDGTEAEVDSADTMKTYYVDPAPGASPEEEQYRRFVGKKGRKKGRG